LLLLLVPSAGAEVNTWYELPLVGERSEELPLVPVLGLVPFDGRLYVRTAGKKGVALPIFSYDPKKDELVLESPTETSALGRFRVIGGKLHIPEAGVKQGHAGYWRSDGGKRWQRVAVEGGYDGFDDIAAFDGKMFLVGSQKRRAVVLWREGAEEEWHVERMTAQATRFSARASRFLTTREHLYLLSQRYISPKARFVAPMSWGPWYVLRYHPKGSERGFLFDGPPCPTRALCLLAPESSILSEGHSVAGEVPFGDSLLYVVLGPEGLARDQKGALFRARTEKALPWCGETLVAERVPGLELIRGVAVSEGKCHVLLAEDTSRQAKVVSTSDLKQWQTVFDGEVPDQATAIGILDGVVYVGLLNGQIGKIDE